MCGLLLFFLRSWQRRCRSEIGCYSARRGPAFHYIAWEMFEPWRKNNRWVQVWEFFVMKWPGLISLEKPKRKDISLHDRSSAWRTRLFKFKWRKPCVGLRHFFLDFLSKLVRSWCRPICREMTGISRYGAVITEGENWSCTVNLLLHVWRPYACNGPPSGLETVLSETCWLSFSTTFFDISMEWTRIVCLPSRIPVFLKIKNKKNHGRAGKSGRSGMINNSFFYSALCPIFQPFGAASI